MTATMVASCSRAEQRGALAAFSRAVGREMHVFHARPDLFWQQLHNRLQWEGEPVSEQLVREYERRGAPGATPWLRTLSPFRESEALVRTIRAHDERVTACAISPDGSCLVSASSDATLMVWDIGAGVQRVTLAGHTGAVNACAVGPDGSYVVSASSDATLRLWDPLSGAELRILRGHADAVNACAVSRDGTFIVSAGQDGTLRLWDPRTGAETACLSAPAPHDTTPLTSCAVSADGSFLVSGTYDNKLRLWDAATGEERATFGDGGNVDIISGCALSPDDSFIASCGFENTVLLWDVRAAEKRATLVGHTGRVFDCAVSPDGSYILSASQDATLRLWDSLTGQHTATLEAHTWAVTACAVGPGGSSIVSGDDSGILKLWDARVAREQTALSGHTRFVNDCAFAPDGSFAVSAGSDRTVRAWDAGTGRERAVLTGHVDQVNACAVSPDGGFIVSASSDGTLAVWDAATGAERTRLGTPQVHFSPYEIDPNLDSDGRALFGAAAMLRTAVGTDSPVGGHMGPVLCCAVSADGSSIASGGEDCTVRVWDVEGGHERATLKGHAPPIGWVTGCAFAPDGSYILSAGQDATLRLWDPHTGRECATLVGHEGAVTDCAIAPDGSYILSASQDGTLRLWDPRTGRGSATLAGHEGAVTDCAIAPDGSCILSAGEDATLRLWDPQTGRQGRKLVGHGGPVTACAIASDGSFAVSGSADNTLRFWDIETGAEFAALPLLGEAGCIDVHPSRPLVVCGDRGTNVYLVDPVGVEYGPTIVTAVEEDGEPSVCCPSCLQRHAFDKSRCGTDVRCPTPGCEMRLRLNPFTAGSHGDAIASGPTAGGFVGARPLGARAAEAAAGAQAAMSGQDWETAIRRFGEAIGLASEDEFNLVAVDATGPQAVSSLAFLHGQRATAHAHNGDWQQALDDYDEALQRDPQNVYCLDNRARIHHVTGDYEPAVRGFSEALALLPPSDERAAQILAYRAESQKELGRLDLARADLAEAAELCRDPALAATIERCTEELSTGDRVLAAKKRCVQCGEVVELLRFRCPGCSSEMFDVLDPDQKLVEAMWERQQLSQEHVDQGGRLFQQGLADEALKEFEQAVEANPWNATAHGNIGVVFLRRGQPGDALEWLERALEIDPNVPGVKEMVAQVRRQLG